MDLNADVGEREERGEGGEHGERGERGERGEDGALIALITQANVACGGHTGNADTMRRTVALCRTHGVKIGAHPSYPDREHFGRRAISISPDELRDSLRAQIQSLIDVAGSISHVKPHGALYHAASQDPEIARVVLEVARDVPVMLMAGCATSSMFPNFLGEAFADRRYHGGALLPRSDPRALITAPDEAAAQALRLAKQPGVTTICVHSDTPNAIEIARAVRRVLFG